MRIYSATTPSLEPSLRKLYFSSKAIFNTVFKILIEMSSLLKYQKPPLANP